MSKLFPAKAGLLAVVASVMAGFALAPAAFGAPCADCDPGGGGGGTPNTAPTAAFGFAPSVPNVGTAIQFSNSSSDSDGSVSSYSWSFGDGRTSTAATPSISYSTPGTYQVTLTVTDNDGAASQPVSHNIRVNAPPTGSINGAPATAETGDSVAFNGSAADPDGSIAGMLWGFGDGASVDAVSTFHTYTQAGVYDVTLTISDHEGGVTVVHHQLTVSDPVVDPDPDPDPGSGGGGDTGGGNTGGGNTGGGSTGGDTTGGTTTDTTGGSTPPSDPAPQPVVAAGEAAQGGPAKDTAAPVLVVPASLTAKKKAGKLAYSVKSDEAVTVVATLKGKVKGGATIRIAKAGSGKVVIKLSSKAKKALRAAKSVKLTLVTTATDASGNTTTKTTKVTLV